MPLISGELTNYSVVRTSPEPLQMIERDDNCEHPKRSIFS
jgi:hypothetical protein